MFAGTDKYGYSVIDFATGVICPVPQPQRTPYEGSFGITLKDRVWVCGGFQPDFPDDEFRMCSQYSPETDAWIDGIFRLEQGREYAMSAKVGDNLWWITGGNDVLGEFLDSTECVEINEYGAISSRECREWEESS